MELQNNISTEIKAVAAFLQLSILFAHFILVRIKSRVKLQEKLFHCNQLVQKLPSEQQSCVLFLFVLPTENKEY